MKLNSAILFDSLNEMYSITIFGVSSEKLSISRPRFYDASDDISEDNLYIMNTSSLLKKLKISDTSLVIAFGSQDNINLVKNNYCIMYIADSNDMFSIFNSVQKVFDKFDNWNHLLMENLNTTANISELIAQSLSIFENPIFILDSRFKYIAQSNYKCNSNSSKNDNLPLPKLVQFLEHYEPYIQDRKPLLFNIENNTTLNQNIYDKNRFLGCITINYEYRKHRESDIYLISYLSNIIKIALQKNDSIITDDRGLLRKNIVDLISGKQTTLSKNPLLNKDVLFGKFICIHMKMSNRFAKLPIGYVCNMIEEHFERSLSFEYDNNIVCIIDFNINHYSSIDYKVIIEKYVVPFIKTFDAKVGISDIFTDLNYVNIFFKQSKIALSNGNIFNPTDQFYLFKDYALNEMMFNLLGDLPLQAYFPEGFIELLNHDQSSNVEYLNTLQLYLDQNMSKAKTAELLCLHRSTLIERIARIESKLNIDLNDPDERLLVQLLLKAISIQNKFNVNKSL